MEKITFKEINYLDTFPVRSAVLRQGKPIETCFFIGDDAVDTIHFGLFTENNLIGVASVFKTNNENFDQKNQFQLRGMAILEEYQSSGFGKLLIKEIFNFIKINQTELLWFNARETAVSFYEKQGCIKKGASFEISEIGTHFLMYKYFDI
ncbi:GNAT family N-acetyltransferase [Flavobacterium sp.]|jgi:predicted GNAT family N-acyltransferase|uniref:GNAT family N-acetyltransferase n=1 Tax=Flavobacterium sp. TaxID=239 RepID=UPI0037BE824A